VVAPVFTDEELEGLRRFPEIGREELFRFFPLHLTAGTPVEWPEDGAAVGVVARFDAIGIRIDEFVERINVRSALADEVERLGLPVWAAFVQVIERTYYAAGTPVEATDIVLPGGRYELVYRVPVD
jgi:hypothetical protein